jgi:hypothetical protein
MFRHHHLRYRVAVAGAVIGGSLGTAALGSASGATPAPTLPGLTQIITGLSALHLSPASLLTASRDYRALDTAAATPGDTGLGPVLEALSQVKGIKGTQFGEDLSTLAGDSDNEDEVVYQNEVAGLEKLEAESASFPAPFNELFYDLAAAFLKDAQGPGPAVSSQRVATASSTGSLTGALKAVL